MKKDVKEFAKENIFLSPTMSESRNFRRKKIFFFICNICLHIGLTVFLVTSRGGWSTSFFPSNRRNCDPHEIFKYNIFLYSTFFFSPFKPTMNRKKIFSYSLVEIWCWKSLDKRNLTSFSFLEKSWKFKIHFLALIYPWWVLYWFVDENLNLNENVEKKNDIWR